MDNFSSFKLKKTYFRWISETVTDPDLLWEHASLWRNFPNKVRKWQKNPEISFLCHKPKLFQIHRGRGGGAIDCTQCARQTDLIIKTGGILWISLSYLTKKPFKSKIGKTNALWTAYIHCVFIYHIMYNNIPNMEKLKTRGWLTRNFLILVLNMFHGCRH